MAFLAAKAESRILIATAAILACPAAAGCGGDGEPLQAQLSQDTAEQVVLGFPALATKNTTRVAGKDATADAAGVSQAVYPSQTPGQRPSAVVLVDKGDWQGGVAASVLAAPPLRAPILLTDGDSIPDVTSQALDTLNPKGFRKQQVQAFSIGNAGGAGLKAVHLRGKDPYTVAAGIDAARQSIAGHNSANVIVASGEQPDFALPAAAYAARSGDSVLFSSRDQLPTVTRNAIKKHRKPSIYLLGPSTVISNTVLKKLKRLGPTVRISGATPVSNAIAFARYSNGSFGWGVSDPGHGLVIANVDRPLDAVAAAPLAVSGSYAPLLLTDSASDMAAPLKNFLLDIQPGYRFDPVRGVYNHVWIMGDESAVSLRMQNDLDAMAEIIKVQGQQPEQAVPTGSTGSTGATGATGKDGGKKP